MPRAHTHFEQPALSHDGTTLAYVRMRDTSPAGPVAQELWVADVDGRRARRVADGWDRFRHRSRSPPTTRRSDLWDLEFTPEGSLANSPHRFVDEIRTPMLVIHGDRDYRVPVGEALRLWSDLAAHHAAPDGTMVHRFLYFPDENHWIAAPQHAVVWYETVLAFLAEHVLGKPWSRPAGM